MRSKWCIQALLAGGAISLVSSALQAKEWFVAPGGSGNGDSATPFGKIQQGLAAAQPGDIVTLRAGSYAEALLSVATAEGRVSEIEDELFAVSQALRGNEDLRTALSDAHVPITTRQQIVEDLLGRKASATTLALVSMVVGAGRADDLPAIVDAMVEKSAAARNRGVARVRSAIELTDEQQTRLADAIAAATGTEVDVRVIVDPTVMGGVITELGDDIIDGSVRSRLSQMRESFR